MKACRECRYVVEHEKKCPKCGAELSDKYSGLIIIVDPEKSEIAKVAGINAIGS